MAHRFKGHMPVWVKSLTDNSDLAQDSKFEGIFHSLVRLSDPSAKRHAQTQEYLEYALLTRELRPSARQQARFWYYSAQCYLVQQQYAEALEALLLCERQLPLDDAAVLALIQTLRRKVTHQRTTHPQKLSSALRHLLPSKINTNHEPPADALGCYLWS